MLQNKLHLDRSLCAAALSISAQQAHLHTVPHTSPHPQLYEPHLYLGNPTEKLFARYFGTKRRHVCSFGFEANPIHTSRLQRLQEALQAHALPARIFTSTAVVSSSQVNRHGSALPVPWFHLHR